MTKNLDQTISIHIDLMEHSKQQKVTTFAGTRYKNKDEDSQLKGQSTVTVLLERGQEEINY